MSFPPARRNGQAFGARCQNEQGQFRLERFSESAEVTDHEFDFSAMPDVAMTGMAMATFYEGKWRFTGLESLRVKECDRIEAMRLGLAQLGVEVSVAGDDVTIQGGSYWMSEQNLKTLEASQVKTDSFDDHRIAMCFGVLRSALLIRLQKESATELTEEDLFQIGEPECVAKTWPSFWEDLAMWAEK